MAQRMYNKWRTRSTRKEGDRFAVMDEEQKDLYRTMFLPDTNSKEEEIAALHLYCESTYDATCHVTECAASGQVMYWGEGAEKLVKFVMHPLQASPDRINNLDIFYSKVSSTTIVSIYYVLLSYLCTTIILESEMVQLLPQDSPSLLARSLDSDIMHDHTALILGRDGAWRWVVGFCDFASTVAGANKAEKYPTNRLYCFRSTGPRPRQRI
jgi:hypothetical protein